MHLSNQNSLGFYVYILGTSKMELIKLYKHMKLWLCLVMPLLRIPYFYCWIITNIVLVLNAHYHILVFLRTLRLYDFVHLYILLFILILCPHFIFTKKIHVLNVCTYYVLSFLAHMWVFTNNFLSTIYCRSTVIKRCFLHNC